MVQGRTTPVETEQTSISPLSKGSQLTKIWRLQTDSPRDHTEEFNFAETTELPPTSPQKNLNSGDVTLNLQTCNSCTTFIGKISKSIAATLKP
ncbi:hypothetical protein Mp_5g10250 [Marchantia polymorpha subsp. ruderalis]|uniref:Uncharacterized protein n=2 Tax=Marchantia polymorpha TaxID=3197 RepID=A0AAF6BGV6_MARPO|nr:hypothetical protein MARPO_0048s0049 [Marchantia polymorpha]BBN11240.1 hypothetical protein Mp_5g10250 [Marchantia polymorpha subsp. ruderalis]|eukprot:PTQ38931.1 hypothetical protein MARPO_0048s0049 [Marchantia polymorpha]